MLELMRFPSELIDVSEFKGPAEKSVGKAEMQMAEQLIESMTTEWEPEQYTDEYRDALENLIEEKIEHGDKAAPAPSKKKRPSNVVDLVSVLQESIQQSQGKAKADKPVTKARATSKKAPEEEAGRMKGFLRDNGLSLVLIALFVLFFAGQAVFGWLNYNDEQDEHYQPQIGFVQYSCNWSLRRGCL